MPSRMRHNVLRLFLCLLTVGVAFAQSPTIGVIDFYGNRKITTAQIRKALGFAEGAPLPGSKADVESRLEEIPGVRAARVQAACCDDGGKAILYVGIDEAGTPEIHFHSAPSGTAELPDEVGPLYASFLQAVAKAGHEGNTAEDLTRGHSLMAAPAVRSIQERFATVAAKHLETLREVLATSASEEQRAIAAYLIGYAPDKSKVVEDLQNALQDPDETVRNNAMRSLGAFAVLSRVDPESGVKVSPSWFIALLNSVDWGDRHNAAVNLVTLTDSRDQKVLSELRARAMPSLMEMAQWKHLEHALPPYILLGRVLRMPEDKLQEAWSNNQREMIIRRARAVLHPPATGIASKPAAK
jgi:hypothetical protein